MVATPRNEKNPTMSVTVVSTMELDCAGSNPSRLSTIGMAAPEKPAATIDTTIAIEITATSPSEPLHSQTANAHTAATAKPFNTPTFTSFHTTHGR